MKAKLIKPNDQFFVVDDSEIQIGNWFISIPRQTFHKCTGIFENNLIDCSCEIREHVEIYRGDCKLITHSTEPLEGVKYLDLSYVEEVVYGYSVEKMAETDFESIGADFASEALKSLAIHDWTRGFNACKELMKDKLFTIEDMEKTINKAFNIGNQRIASFTSDYDSIINSLLPKTEWDIDIDEQGKITLI